VGLCSRQGPAQAKVGPRQGQGSTCRALVTLRDDEACTSVNCAGPPKELHIRHCSCRCALYWGPLSCANKSILLHTPHVLEMTCPLCLLPCALYLAPCTLIAFGALPFLQNTTLLLLPAGVLFIFAPLCEIFLPSYPARRGCRISSISLRRECPSRTFGKYPEYKCMPIIAGGIGSICRVRAS